MVLTVFHVIGLCLGAIALLSRTFADVQIVLSLFVQFSLKCLRDEGLVQGGGRQKGLSNAGL